MKNTPDSLSAPSADEIMQKAQVFYSAWSMVGGPFDGGNMRFYAEEATKDLRAGVEALVAAANITATASVDKQSPALANLRHLYENLVSGGVASAESAKSAAEGLLGPVIVALERAQARAATQVATGAPLGWLRNERNDATGPATRDPLFLVGVKQPEGYTATYTPVAALSAPQGAEPVGWRIRSRGQQGQTKPGFWRMFSGPEKPVVDDSEKCDIEPLYAAPPSQQGEVRPEHIEKLLHAWEQRSSSAFPADAMLINKHIRELREVCGAQNTKATGQPSLSLTDAPQAPTAVTAPTKAQFEAWAKSEGGDFAFYECGPYNREAMKLAGMAWKACAAIAAQEGKP